MAVSTHGSGNYSCSLIRPQNRVGVKDGANERHEEQVTTGARKANVYAKRPLRNCYQKDDVLGTAPLRQELT